MTGRKSIKFVQKLLFIRQTEQAHRFVIAGEQTVFILTKAAQGNSVKYMLNQRFRQVRQNTRIYVIHKTGAFLLERTFNAF